MVPMNPEREHKQSAQLDASERDQGEISFFLSDRMSAPIGSTAKSVRLHSQNRARVKRAQKEHSARG